MYYFLGTLFNWAILGSSSFDFVGIISLNGPGEGDVMWHFSAIKGNAESLFKE